MFNEDNADPVPSRVTLIFPNGEVFTDPSGRPLGIARIENRSFPKRAKADCRQSNRKRFQRRNFLNAWFGQGELRVQWALLTDHSNE